MVIPMRRQQDPFGGLFRWALEGLGLVAPPARSTVTLVDATSLSPELSTWLETSTETCYQQAIIGDAGDGVIGLVREDGAIDSLSIADDGFVLCTPSACTLLVPPDALHRQLALFDTRELPAAAIEVSGLSRPGAYDLSTIAQFYFALSKETRTALRAIDASGRPVDAAQPPVFGMARIGMGACSSPFFADAARALAIRKYVEGKPLIESWARISGPATDEGIDFAAGLDDLASTMSRIYQQPGQVRNAAAANPEMAARLQLLSAEGFLRRDQQAFFRNETDEMTHEALGDTRCTLASAR